MRVLFICKDNPYGVGGGMFASRAYLKSFSDISQGNVDLFLASHIKVDDSIKIANLYKVGERSIFNKLSSVFSGHMHRFVRAVRKHLQMDSNYDYCVFNNSKTCGGLIDVVRSCGIKIITIHHNWEVEYFRDHTPSFIYRNLFLNHVASNEKEAFKKSDINLFLTKQDLNIFIKEYGENTRMNKILGAYEYKKLPELESTSTKGNGLVVAITGSLCTVQGIDGIKYFFHQLYRYLPVNSNIIISGRNPSAEVVELCHNNKNVHLIPNPDDMSAVISSADIYLCPTRLGGGLKLRVMDGLRLGIPVITHSCSARGFDDIIEKGFMFVFEDEKSFKNIINEVVNIIKRGDINRSLVRKAYEEIYSYEAGTKRLSDTLTEFSTKCR